MFWLILQVFVEFENASQRCSWVQVYDEGVKAVLVEDSIVWARRSDVTDTSGASAPAWPALVSAQLETSKTINHPNSLGSNCEWGVEWAVLRSDLCLECKVNGSWITLLVIEIHLKIKCAPDPTLVSPDSLRGDKEKLKRHLHVAHLPHPHLELF